MNRGSFNILSIDGGGIRGAYAAAILELIETRVGLKVLDHFDLIAGTSTGSIIAAGIVAQKSPGELVSLYREQGEAIFGSLIATRWPECIRQLFCSTYLKVPLAEILAEQLGEIRLGEISKPLIIPASDVGNGGVHVFKSAYSDAFTRDGSVLLRDAVLASCSAPVFFDPTKVGNYLLADGGLWANNPTMVALIDAQYRLNVAMDQVRVLSIGTGHSRLAYGTEQQRPWGLLKGWKGKSFINYLLSLQSQSVTNYAQLTLGNRVLRLDFESDAMLPLDDARIVDDLISRADRDFTHQSQAIRNFLEATSENVNE